MHVGESFNLTKCAKMCHFYNVKCLEYIFAAEDHSRIYYIAVDLLVSKVKQSNKNLQYLAIMDFYSCFTFTLDVDYPIITDC